MLSLILLAPWLPPKTKTIGKSDFIPKLFNIFNLSVYVRFNFFIFVGVPVTTTLSLFSKNSLVSLNPS